MCKYVAKMSSLVIGKSLPSLLEMSLGNLFCHNFYHLDYFEVVIQMLFVCPVIKPVYPLINKM